MCSCLGLYVDLRTHVMGYDLKSISVFVSFHKGKFECVIASVCVCVFACLCVVCLCVFVGVLVR